MKRGRKTAADRLPVPPDLRAQWQKDNAACCGCRGADDMCPCQNDPDLFTRRPEIEVTREQFATLQADFNDCNSERARWKSRAEAAESLNTTLASRLKEAEEALKANRDALSIARGWATKKPDSERAVRKIDEAIARTRAALKEPTL